jgi:hypothetical protein
MLLQQPGECRIVLLGRCESAPAKYAGRNVEAAGALEGESIASRADDQSDFGTERACRYGVYQPLQSSSAA